MSAELRQVAAGFSYRVLSFTGYDVNGYRFHTRTYEEGRPGRRTTNTGVLTPGLDGVEYYGIVEDIYQLNFHGSKPLTPVIFKCHWFDPQLVRRTPSIGLVEIQQDSVLPGDDVYIVAQQATQVYYASYPCQNDNLKSWSVVYKVRPHGKLPLPNDADYTVDPNTYHGDEFYQDDGLEGTFEIDLTDMFEMEVENEDAAEEVDNPDDLRELERLRVDAHDTHPPANLDVDIDLCESDEDNYDRADPNDDDYF